MPAPRTLPRRLAGPALLLALAASLPASADGPKDNLPDNVRPIPPKGIDLPPADEAEIRKGLTELQAEIKAIGKHELLPDVEVYEKAVRYAVDYKEVFDAKGIPAVKTVLKTGLERARLLREGKAPWATATGYVVRGYRSKIDGSPQPYGLLVPAGYEFKGDGRHRLDFWWHGRGETLSEVNFMANPQSASGIIPAPGAFILFPYGRYCNANKFAGEIDTFECLEHARKHYRIDENRVVARGFSMGGAACWQFAVHYPTLWCAAAPGAGFAETPEFLDVFQKEKVEPTWYEKKLWRMYNATDYAVNLFNLPTVAYSGEIDRQKQAADVMTREMKKVGLELVHVIGPKTGHSYEKAAKAEVNKRIDAIVEKGKNPFPDKIRFTTFTVRYDQCAWVTIVELGKHWERAQVDGEIQDEKLVLKTENVTALQVSIPAYGDKRLFEKAKRLKTAEVDGTSFPLEPIDEMTGIQAGFSKADDGKWVPFIRGGRFVGSKRHGLQGPLDDAFMAKFIFVRPTGKPLHELTGKWVEAEMRHAVEHWRKQFRGDAVVKDDTAVTEHDILTANLVLWGDALSNKLLGKMAAQLPAKWIVRREVQGGQEVEVTRLVLGDKEYPSETHMPVLIYPNPLNPNRYVVLNSGFTFREYDYLNNARQVPKLPDYAVLDVTTPSNSRHPGKVVRAGFFGEKWELLPDDGK
jgi:hypothetical protein